MKLHLPWRGVTLLPVTRHGGADGPRSLREVALMRRMMLFVTVALLAAAMIAAGALPTFAKQAKGEGRELGASTCEVPGTTYPSI